MTKLMIAGLLAVFGLAPAIALAQAQAEETDADLLRLAALI